MNVGAIGRKSQPKPRRLHAFENADAYPTLKHHIGDRIDTAAIRDGWSEALRVGVSIEDRIVAPSTVLKKLASLPRTNVLSRALREISRIQRMLFMIVMWNMAARAKAEFTLSARRNWCAAQRQNITRP